MSLKTKDIDRGYKRALAELEIAKSGPVVAIGFQGAKGAAPHKGGDGVTVADVATFNEFGTLSKGNPDGIPERSFIRSTMDENRKDLLKLNEKLFFQMGTGKMTTSQALKILGEKITALIKKKITDLKDPPNKPSTIARKKSSNPLIDSGQMRQSVEYDVRMDGSKSA